MSALDSLLSSLYSKADAAIGVGSGYASRVAQLESGGNPNAQAGSSSAGGLFQFINSTWNAYGNGSRFDPSNATSAFVKFSQANFGALSNALGRNPTQGELYLAHQQGADGAIGLLSNPAARAADIVGFDAVMNNGGTYEMTAAEFAQKWTGKFDGEQTRTAGSGAAGIVSSAYASLESWFGRGTVIILGFIFVAVGLALFKPTMQIVQQTKGVAKAGGLV